MRGPPPDAWPCQAPKLAADEDMRGGAPRPPCVHVWRTWTARDGQQQIHDCALCGDRVRS